MMELTLIWMFFKVGITSFGGGYGMMSMIMDEGARLVGLTTDEFADMAALDFICSGPIALNAATYIGYIKDGFLGSVCATLGVIAPCIIVCTVALVFLEKFYKSVVIRGLFAGIKPACGGLLLYTAISLCKTVIFDASTFSEVIHTQITTPMILTALLAVAALVMDQKFKMNPIVITVIGAVFGAIFLR